MESKIDRKVATARRLRRSQTSAEDILWSRLRRNQLGVAFRRQHPIGPFVVDFCCVGARLVVELDGAIHDEDDVAEQDAWRSEYLAQRGFLALRFRNEEVATKPHDVITPIQQHLSFTSSSVDRAKAPLRDG